jgi:serine/threonine protein phosphatase 1
MKKMGRRLVLGDIHGAHIALEQVLERSGYIDGTDRIIFIGDICDGWPDTPKTIDLLHSLSNLVHVCGNHDYWMAQHLLNQDWSNDDYVLWDFHGGRSTRIAYHEQDTLALEHISILRNKTVTHHLEDDNILFVHAGFIPWIPFSENVEYDFRWDRTLWHNHMRGIYNGVKNFKEVYIGHTPVNPMTVPKNYGNLWNVDTGAAYTGFLSLMDVDTKELFQSDRVQDLYPGHRGRN